MQNQEIQNYINARYDRWADYSLFHSTHQGLEDQYIDILNEVLEAVLKKKEDYLIGLYNQKKNGYTGLDYLILSMIKMYCTSPLAPYRWKHDNRLPIDANADYRRIEIIDEPDADIDRAGQITFEMDITRWIFERLALDDLEVCVFNWKFFEGEPLTDWPIANEMKNLYNAYSIVERTIYEILRSQGLTRAKPKDKRYDVKRVQLLVRIFEKCHLKAFLAEKNKLESILENVEV
ncbi:MAG: hypothetical protein E6767_03105 [Dysgonomonas sp.]|nr:hypothetical protein [Dysgonomonas sp.]